MTAPVTDLAAERMRRRSPDSFGQLRRRLERLGIVTSSPTVGHEPPRARMTFDEWLELIDAEPIGHSEFCPHRRDPRLDCGCVSCHCGTFVPGGELGTCGRCRRPLIVDGKVAR